MDVDEFGFPMPPSAEMDDISFDKVNGDHAPASFAGDSSSVGIQQTPSSTTNAGISEKALAGDAADGIISSTTATSHVCVAGAGDLAEKLPLNNPQNGFYPESSAKLTSREPYTHRLRDAVIPDVKRHTDVDDNLTNSFVLRKPYSDMYSSSNSKIHNNENDIQFRNEYRPSGFLNINARNGISELPRDTLNAGLSSFSSKLLSSSAGGNHSGDSLSIFRRTSESAACQQCSSTESSASFAAALAKASMLSHLSSSGEDSGLGGGGVGSHEMAEIMHNYVRALHTSPAFQQFIQHRATGGTSSGSSTMVGDSLHPELSLSTRNYSHHAIPSETTALSFPGTSAAAAAANSSKSLSPRFLHESGLSHHLFSQWSESEQVLYVEFLLDQMQHSAQSRVNLYLRPKLQRDFISLLPKLGMQHIAETILEKLEEHDLRCAETVSPEWYRAIADGMQWKKLIERNVVRDTLWRGLGERRGWIRHLFKRLASQYPAQMAPMLSNDYFRALYPDIVKDIKRLEDNWRSGKHNLHRINCRSENSKGVYCLQYDEDKIISGLRDNTIKIWDKKTLQLQNTLRGHNGSVLCLQYDDKIIISGSSDATVRVWDVKTGEQLAHLLHHCEAVLHLRFGFGIMVTCSKDRSIAVWDMTSSRDINFRRNLVGHRAAVNVVDFDEKYIVSASGDRSIKVWNTQTCELVRNLVGHRRGIACLQYRDKLVVSGSSDYTIRIWDIEQGHCLRTLEGHEELVRCIRFDSKRIVSGAYDGKIKVWDLEAALDMRRSAASLCTQTLVEHTGRVFRLQFDEFQIVSSSHDDTILIWDFFNGRSNASSVTASAQTQQHHQGGGGGGFGGLPPDGGNNNAGGAAPGGGGGAGGGNAHFYHHHFMNAGAGGGGGAFPPAPPNGGGADNFDDAELSDTNAVVAFGGEPELSHADLVQSTQRLRHHQMPANVAINSVSQMMLPLQRLPDAGEVNGERGNNSSSASSSSASTPLSAPQHYFVLQAGGNVVISSHSSNDAVVDDHDAGVDDQLPNSKSNVIPVADLLGHPEIMGIAARHIKVAPPPSRNMEPKLSQLELATARALNSGGSHSPLMEFNPQQKLKPRPVTTSSTAAAIASSLGNNPRLLSHGSSHVSSPNLLGSSANSVAGHSGLLKQVQKSNDEADDLARETMELHAGIRSNLDKFVTSLPPMPDADAAKTASSFAKPYDVDNPLPPKNSSSADGSGGAGGDHHGLYVRHKAKRSIAAPVKYYREGGVPVARHVAAGAPDAARVLQQLPASLQKNGKSLIPTFPVVAANYATVGSLLSSASPVSAVSNSSRPVSEADSSSSMTSEMASEPVGGGSSSQLTTTNDGM